MKAIIILTKKQKTELTKRKKNEENSKIYRRYLYLEMSSKGMTNLKIASILGVCNDTLTEWKYIFENKGIEGLSMLHYDGRRKSKLTQYKDEILEKVKKGNVSTLNEIRDFLKKEHGVVVEHSWLSRFCKKNSMYPTKKLA